MRVIDLLYAIPGEPKRTCTIEADRLPETITALVAEIAGTARRTGSPIGIPVTITVHPTETELNNLGVRTRLTQLKNAGVRERLAQLTADRRPQITTGQSFLSLAPDVPGRGWGGGSLHDRLHP